MQQPTDELVDAFISRDKQWGPVLRAIRTVLHTTELTETLKWWQPCYTHNNKNVLIIGSLKECCTIGFFKGALINDTFDLLKKPGPNTQSSRVLRLTSVEQVEQSAQAIRYFVQQSILHAEAGTAVVFAKRAEQELPAELQQALQDDPALSQAFYALTPGRQNAYILHFSGAKQSATRTSRINACKEQILAGKGMRDEYQRNKR